MDYRAKYEQWLNGAGFDADTKAELLSIKDNEEEIRDRFYRMLEFGTAGLRGVIGAGENRMNEYTVRRATQGLANYILKLEKEASVVIAYDSRHMSPEFADIAALCLNANGIRAYVFESLRPTPELSFAVRELHAIAGINITASHNPPEYNGYKVYWEDGAQITPPHDKGIMAEVAAIEDFSVCLSMPKEQAVQEGLYVSIGKEIDDLFVAAVKSQVKEPQAIRKEGKNLKIVYSPFCGTGNIPVRRVLSELGFTNVYVVPEQEAPDGDFPTLSYPNPEDKAAFKLALKLAAEKDADLVLATDPDADRLGVYVKDTKSGEYKVLTGNMSGCLLAEYTISRIKENTGLPADGVLVKSIVSSNLADAIADYYGIGLTETLTGFKYVGLEILKMEQSGKGTYLFGFEESYGCLIGTHARDKDAIVASMALCEAAAYWKTKGMTLWDALLEMYERYGYFREDVVSVTMKGAEGLQKIADIMEHLRREAPEEIGGRKVLVYKDYSTAVRKDMLTGAETETGLPKANVLYYDFADGEWLCVRPSGTEPKIKLYIGVRGNSLKDAEARAAAFKAEAEKLLEI